MLVSCALRSSRRRVRRDHGAAVAVAVVRGVDGDVRQRAFRRLVGFSSTAFDVSSTVASSTAIAAASELARLSHAGSCLQAEYHLLRQAIGEGAPPRPGDDDRERAADVVRSTLGALPRSGLGGDRVMHHGTPVVTSFAPSRDIAQRRVMRLAQGSWQPRDFREVAGFAEHAVCSGEGQTGIATQQPALPQSACDFIMRVHFRTLLRVRPAELEDPSGGRRLPPTPAPAAMTMTRRLLLRDAPTATGVAVLLALLSDSNSPQLAASRSALPTRSVLSATGRVSCHPLVFAAACAVAVASASGPTSDSDARWCLLQLLHLLRHAPPSEASSIATATLHAAVNAATMAACDIETAEVACRAVAASARLLKHFSVEPDVSAAALKTMVFSLSPDGAPSLLADVTADEVHAVLRAFGPSVLTEMAEAAEGTEAAVALRLCLCHLASRGADAETAMAFLGLTDHGANKGLVRLIVECRPSAAAVVASLRRRLKSKVARLTEPDRERLGALADEIARRSRPIEVSFYGDDTAVLHAASKHPRRRRKLKRSRGKVAPVASVVDAAARVGDHLWLLPGGSHVLRRVQTELRPATPVSIDEGALERLFASHGV